MEYSSQVEIPGGWLLQRFETVPSTNSMLAERAQSGAPEGLCISARHQSAGKGRLGRTWIDRPGSSILLSILTRPVFAAADYFSITMALALAAAESLLALGVQTTIKWPNDLLIGDEKVAGILSEAGGASGGRWVVGGIGMNVDQTDEELDSLERKATSLRSSTGRRFSPGEIQRLELGLVGAFQERYLALQADFAAGSRSLFSDYRARCSTLHSFVRVALADGEYVSGQVLDINNQGQLLVELDSCIRQISAGDVEHLYRAN